MSVKTKFADAFGEFSDDDSLEDKPSKTRSIGTEPTRRAMVEDDVVEDEDDQGFFAERHIAITFRLLSKSFSISVLSY